MEKKRRIIGAILLLAAGLMPVVAAHSDLQEQYYEQTWFFLLPFIAIIAGALLVHYYESKKQQEKQLKTLKKAIFLGIVVITAFVSLVIFYETIKVNTTAWSKGPVHWHADFQVWNCNQRLDLIDPKGFSNKVGTPVFHEHNDDRIHVEGDVLHPEDISLKEFMRVIGGAWIQDLFSYPTNKPEDEIITMKNGMLCKGKPAQLQVFVYHITNPHNTKKWVMTQEKITDVDSYLLAPYANVPPGDCIIIEFAEEKARTDHLCETYAIAMKKGELAWR